MENNEKSLGEELNDALDEVLSGKGKLRRVRSSINPADIRRRLNLTQEEFAKRYHFSLSSLRNWEQGMRKPDASTEAYLTCINIIPEAIENALNSKI